MCIWAGEYPESSDWGTEPGLPLPSPPLLSRPPHAPPSDTRAARSLPALHTLSHTPQPHSPKLSRVSPWDLSPALGHRCNPRAHNRAWHATGARLKGVFPGRRVQSPRKAPAPAAGALNATTAPWAVLQPTYSHTDAPRPRTEKPHRLSYSCTVSTVKSSLPNADGIIVLIIFYIIL